MNKLLQRAIAYLLGQYVTVLGIMGIVATVSYLSLIYGMKAQESDAVLIRLSGLQSQLFHQTNFQLSLLLETSDATRRQALRGQILHNIVRIGDTHLSLKQGDRYVQAGGRLVYVSGDLPENLQRLYFDPPSQIDRRVNEYIKAVKSILSLPSGQLNSNHPLVAEIFSDELKLLDEGLDKATSLYQKQSEYKLNSTMDKQNFFYGITLISFAIVGVGILNPLVSKLKGSLSQLQEEKDFSENLLDTSQAFIIAIDPKGEIVNFNQFTEENTGWFLSEAKGVKFLEHFIPEEDRDRMQKLFDNLLQGDGEFANEIETGLTIRSGERLRIAWHNSAVRIPKTRQPMLLLATGIDITQRKLAEHQLQQTLFEFEEISSRLQDEVDLAASLQKVLLPNPSIELPGLQGYVKLITSSEVGGDYYDYFQVEGTSSVVLIGDVSGHGVAAGTMVSAIKAGTSSLINKGISNPSDILYSLNETMLSTAGQSLLMTMACINLDARTGKVVFSNAGHVLPYHKKKQSSHWTIIEASGLPLGSTQNPEYNRSETEIQMEVGDRLFLFTDALVEEESSTGEPFGYEQLEYYLDSFGELEPADFFEQLLAELSTHCGRDLFTDDLTMLVLNHTDRVTLAVSADSGPSDIIRLSDTFYRLGEHPVPHISRQYIVLSAEGEFADLLPRLREDGICRILPKNSTFYHRLGWDRFENQHRLSPDDDLAHFIPPKAQTRQFELTHSDDKVFLIGEIEAWLSEQDLPESDYVESLIILLDELIENSLYAAPRDGQDKPYYTKGEARELKSNEAIRLDVGLSGDTLGLMVTDNWGTLTPSMFLKSMDNAMQQGVVAGVGGGGLYMMWCLSDYLQIRVHPHRQTQVTLLWDLSKPFALDLNSGFQCLYHREQDEVVAA